MMFVKLSTTATTYAPVKFYGAIILPAHDRCINVEEHFGVLGEHRRGLEVLEFWEFWSLFVRDLYGRFGNRGIACIAGILRISKLSVFNTDVGFDSRRLHHT
jgi:hypothetical protein